VRVVILIGMPASGKSTFRRTHLDPAFVCVSKDDFTSNRRPARRQANLTREALEPGQSVIIDNTSVTREDRAAIIEIAREYGAEVVGYVFESVVNDCKLRNELREGKAKVPDVAIYTAAKTWCWPTLDEGFHELFAVRIAENGFDVTTYTAP
jgi:predicted kinase